MIRSAEELDKLVREAMKNTEGNTFPINSKVKRVAASAMIQFTADEIEQMEDSFKVLFCAEGGIARISKYQVGKRKPTYEIRYCRHGINISVTDKCLKTAKALFIQETQQLNKT